MTKKEQNILIKEYLKTQNKEKKVIHFKEKDPGIIDKIREKIPAKAMNSLETAFEKGFFFLFDKGGVIIEKTGSIEKSRKNSEKFHKSLALMVRSGTLKAIDQATGSKINISKGTATLEGISLGIFGIGLPDIPIFLAMLLKTSYEIAANYGFDYREEKERKYTLSLLKVIFSEGTEREAYSKQCDILGEAIDKGDALDAELSDNDLKAVSSVLATDMLVAKFIQGMTFVGVLGGPLNYRLINKVSKVAKIKYKKRFLFKLIQNSED